MIKPSGAVVLDESNGDPGIQQPLAIARSGARTSRLRLGLGTAIAARCAGAVIQLAAIPVVINSLGIESYTAYASILAISGWASLVTLRNGPSFVGHVAHLSAVGAQSTVAGIWQPALLVTGASALLGVCITAVVIYAVGLAIFLPPQVSTMLVELWGILIFLILAQLVQTSLSPLSDVQAGLQETYLLNVRDLVGSVLSAAAILLAFPKWPTLWAVVLAIHVPRLAATVVNAASLFRRHPWLAACSIKPMWRAYLPLAAEGAAYSAVAGISAYLCHSAPILFMTQFAPAHSAAEYVVLLQLVLQAFAVVSLLTNPVIPAVRDAVSCHDLAWLRSAILRLSLAVVGVGVGGALMLGVAGNLFFSVVLKSTVMPSLQARTAAGAYFTALAIEFTLFSLLLAIATQRQRVFVYVGYFIRALATGFACAVCARGGHVAAAFAFAGVAALVNSLFLILIAWRRWARYAG